MDVNARHIFFYAFFPSVEHFSSSATAAARAATHPYARPAPYRPQTRPVIAAVPSPRVPQQPTPRTTVTYPRPHQSTPVAPVFRLNPFVRRPFNVPSVSPARLRPVPSLVPRVPFPARGNPTFTLPRRGFTSMQFRPLPMMSRTARPPFATVRPLVTRVTALRSVGRPASTFRFRGGSRRVR